MLLNIRPTSGATTVDGRLIEHDRYYQMPDGVHRFIVRRIGDRTFLIQIKKGKATVQSGTIRPLSATAGQMANGESIIRYRYAIELNPNKPIFPIEQLVTRLQEVGIEWHQISPMFEPEFSTCVANRSSPHMASGRQVSRVEFPASGNLMRNSEFRGENLSWAILYFGTDINHVYLWMDADEGAVLDAIRRIHAGEMVPSYAP